MKISKKEIIIGAAGLLAGVLLFIVIDLLSSTEPDEVKVVQAEEGQIWTCSMHPQIRQSEPGDCPICGMDLIPLSTGGSGESSPFIYTMTPEAEALANVQTVKASYQSAEYEVYLTGKIAANERKLAAVTADFSGRIEKLYVDFTGQSVRRGEKLATVYSPELITAQRELIETAKSKEVNPALYNAVREKLKLWNITKDQINSIETSGKVLNELDIYSTVSGIVINRNVSTGDYVNKGSVLFEIADLSTIWILLDAYESDLTWIKQGSKINFTVASFPGKEFTSTVTFVDPVINPQTRTASVRAEANNPGLILKPEMFVKATIDAKLSSVKGLTTADNKALVIPKTSVLWTGTRSIVYVKLPGTENPTYEMREIVLGPRAGEFYLVESGIQPGEEVVANGVFAVDAAAQLSGNYSMMNRPMSIRIDVPKEFKETLTIAAKNYLSVKNALAADNSNDAKNNAGKLLKTLNSVDMNSLDEKAHIKWMEVQNELKSSAKSISSSNDIVNQREKFEILSDALIDAAQTFGVNIDMLYVQFCPMAFDDKGAYWLSESSEILNPYFGSEMLECGEVKKKISAVDSYAEKKKDIKTSEAHNH